MITRVISAARRYLVTGKLLLPKWEFLTCQGMYLGTRC
jgi:hypothetical protein